MSTHVISSANPMTRTSTALLNGLFDPADSRSWSEFDARYRSIILAVARGMGLSDPDAADAAQDTILQFIRDYRAGRFDRGRGRLRHWIIGIARHRIADVHRRAAMKGRGVSDAACGEACDHSSDPHRLEELWEQAWRRETLARAVETLRHTLTGEKSLDVLELLFVRGCSPAQSAAALGVTVQDVYVHKSRLAARLRELVAEQERLFEEDHV
jgi:RNA polymerase sigma factor (sigma-70 family)